DIVLPRTVRRVDVGESQPSDLTGVAVDVHRPVADVLGAVGVDERRVEAIGGRVRTTPAVGTGREPERLAPRLLVRAQLHLDNRPEAHARVPARPDREEWELGGEA